MATTRTTSAPLFEAFRALEPFRIARERAEVARNTPERSNPTPAPGPTTGSAASARDAVRNDPMAMQFMSRLQSRVSTAPLADATPAQIRSAERTLKRAGFHPGRLDGKASDNLVRELRKFQRALGLDVTGGLDRRTRRALGYTRKRIARGHLGPGQAGGRVQTVQRRLTRLGYDPGPTNGIYDRQTANAVKAFRRDQPSLKGTSGNLAPAALTVLRREAKALHHAPFRSRVEDTAAHRRADRRTTIAARRRHADGTQGMGRGAKGPSIAYVQQHLRSAGYSPKRADGVFDQRTEGMVEEFQRKSGLPVNGRVDAATWRKLRRAKMEASSATSPPQRIGERSGAVRQTEKKLKKLGFDPGDVDGRFTNATQRALDRFRKKHGVGGRGHGVGPGTKKAIDRVLKRRAGRSATGYVNGQPRKIRVVRVEGHLVEVRTARAYRKMKKAAAKDGVSIRINSGFRTNAKQKYLYDGWIRRLPGFNPAAPPGYSNHQSGIALDLNTLQGSSRSEGVGAVYNWLARNGARFGFGRIASEHWHWEYRR